jgi:hypothetical protein
LSLKWGAVECIRIFGCIMMCVIHTSQLHTGQFFRGLERRENQL